MIRHISRWLMLSLLLIAMPIAAQETADCVTDYDPQVDYFPDKITVQHAENFTVEYANHYKVVTVNNAFEQAEPFTYVLVQCGTPAPDMADFPDNAQQLTVPATDIITMSTTQLPHLNTLGLLDNLIGVDSFLYLNTPEVRERIDSGDLIEVGSGSSVNVEMILEADPSLVITYGFNPSTDAYPILLDVGIPTVLSAEWRETTPLGYAEWLKFMALFYNVEAEAEAAYNDIVTAYDETRALVEDIPAEERPVVLWNVYTSYSEAWIIPGRNTYVGQLIEDAGGQIALTDTSGDSVPMSFEAVYSDALDADVWVIGLFGVSTLDGLLSQDSRYSDFAAVTNGNVWNNSLDVNENGGNNYYEMGVTHPHLILQDLVAIFYPDSLPDHDFNFHLPLE